MRYYLGTCEYKWIYARTDMEHIWIRCELGEELFKTVEDNGWHWCWLRSNSQTLPSDIYCRTDIYVDIQNDAHAMLFALKYSQARHVEKL